MWKLEDLKTKDSPQTFINGKWVPSRPENFKKTCMSLSDRFKNAWEVFMCRAEAFKWPEGQ
jgi:hypothetical protein